MDYTSPQDSTFNSQSIPGNDVIMYQSSEYYSQSNENYSKKYENLNNRIKSRTISIQREPVQKKNNIKTFEICAHCNMNDDDLIITCIHPICKGCIFNQFENYIQTFENEKQIRKVFRCNFENCEKPYQAKSFKDIVLKESLLRYYEYESVLRLDNSNLPSLKACPEYTNSDCFLCGENHDPKEISCFMNFKQKFLCKSCKQKDIEEEIKCGHSLCRQCIVDHIINILEDDPFKIKIPCFAKDCKDIYDIEFIYRMIGGLKKFKSLQEQYVNFILANTKECCICYEKEKINKINAIPCGHEVCNSCLKKYFVSCLNIDQIKYINKCPSCLSVIEGGNESRDSKEKQGLIEIQAIIEIHPSQILRLLNEQERFLYDKLTLKTISRDAFDANTVLKWCRDCDYAEFISIDFGMANRMIRFNCPNCKQRYCAKCNQNHLGITCSQTRDFGVKDEDVIRCPSCREAVFKCQGCNFLKCLWPSCAGINFCALCQKVLRVRFK